jgi:nucleoside-diphosphate-sugar epimerase
VRVFLTGGTGLIGSHVAERLRRRGDEVLALAREESDTTHLESLGCALVRGDVRDAPEDLARSMRSVDAVVHAAALVYARESWPRVRAVNVEGTTHVLEAAALAAIPAAIHVSSVAVYGPIAGPITEETQTETPLAPTDLYARSKRDAEVAALGAIADGGPRLTMIRPSVVYGERDRLFAPRIARVARMPVIPVVGSGTSAVAVVYAGNVAAAIERCLDRPPPDPAVRIFNLGVDRSLTQERLLVGMARALGHSPTVLHIPAGLVRAAAGLGERLGLALPGITELSLSRFTQLILRDNPYRSDRIRNDLNWDPPFSHEVGLRRTAAWLGSIERRSRAA